jgi:hypothetical protein
MMDRDAEFYHIYMLRLAILNVSLILQDPSCLGLNCLMDVQSEIPMFQLIATT